MWKVEYNCQNWHLTMPLIWLFVLIYNNKFPITKGSEAQTEMVRATVDSLFRKHLSEPTQAGHRKNHKPWMKHKEQLCFHYLPNWGISKKSTKAPKQWFTSGKAGTTDLSPCQKIPELPGFTCISGVRTDTFYLTALIFACSRAGISTMFNKVTLRLSQVYVI